MTFRFGVFFACWITNTPYLAFFSLSLVTTLSAIRSYRYVIRNRHDAVISRPWSSVRKMDMSARGFGLSRRCICRSYCILVSHWKKELIDTQCLGLGVLVELFEPSVCRPSLPAIVRYSIVPCGIALTALGIGPSACCFYGLPLPSQHIRCLYYKPSFSPLSDHAFSLPFPPFIGCCVTQRFSFPRMVPSNRLSSPPQL